jgi:hypothetical protein
MGGIGWRIVFYFNNKQFAECFLCILTLKQPMLVK